MQHLNKTSFLSHQPLPLEFAHWRQVVAKPLFGSGTMSQTSSLVPSPDLFLLQSSPSIKYEAIIPVGQVRSQEPTMAFSFPSQNSNQISQQIM